MMKLSPEKIQKSAEKGVRRQRETSVEVSGEEHPLVPGWRGLYLPLLRQPPASGDQETLTLQVLQPTGSHPRGQPIALDEAGWGARARGELARGLLCPLGSHSGALRHIRRGTTANRREAELSVERRSKSGKQKMEMFFLSPSWISFILWLSEISVVGSAATTQSTGACRSAISLGQNCGDAW